MAKQTGYSEKDTDYVFPKKFECPMCGNSFKNMTLKTGKARMIGSDDDLRPIHEGIDTVKYDVVMCPTCGYGTIARNFGPVTQVQKKFFREYDGPNFYPSGADSESVLSYQMALDRYKQALCCSYAKQGPESEKAYLCLKIAWLLRGWRQALGEKKPNTRAALEEKEKDFLMRARDGFKSANLKESYPLCGMDELTVDYLVASLHVTFGEYDEATKLISGVIARGGRSRIKERAHDLKDKIAELKAE